MVPFPVHSVVHSVLLAVFDGKENCQTKPSLVILTLCIFTFAEGPASLRGSGSIIAVAVGPAALRGVGPAFFLGILRGKHRWADPEPRPFLVQDRPDRIQPYLNCKPGHRHWDGSNPTDCHIIPNPLRGTNSRELEKGGSMVQHPTPLPPTKSHKRSERDPSKILWSSPILQNVDLLIQISLERKQNFSILACNPPLI